MATSGDFYVAIDNIDGPLPERGDTAPFEAILEMKDRDFDRMKPTSLWPLIGRDRRQVLRYVASRIDLGSLDEAADGESYVMPTVAYCRSPSDSAIKEMIEAFFAEEMIAVIWEDETVEEAKASPRVTCWLPWDRAAREGIRRTMLSGPRVR